MLGLTASVIHDIRPLGSYFQLDQAPQQKQLEPIKARGSSTATQPTRRIYNSIHSFSRPPSTQSSRPLPCHSPPHTPPLSLTQQTPPSELFPVSCRSSTSSPWFFFHSETCSPHFIMGSTGLPVPECKRNTWFGLATHT